MEPISSIDKSFPQKSIGPAKMTGSTVWQWWREGIDASKDTRKEADKNCAYYDNEQWMEEEKRELDERGQAALVRNEIKPTLDFVIGTERKTRIDFTTAPRTSNDVQNASIASEILKYVGDANHQKFLTSEAFSGTIKAGWQWIEICKNTDPFEDPIALRKVERDDFVWDPYAKQFDRQDGKYMIRGKWIDLEDAVALLPRHRAKLEAAVSSDGGEEEETDLDQPYHGTEDKSDRPGILAWDRRKVSPIEWIDKGRRRLRLLECWYKTPTQTWLSVNDLTSDIDEFDPSRAMELMFTPGIRLMEAMLRKVRLCIVAGNEILEDNPSPYRHNLFPFVPFWAYLTDKKRMPYGLITQLRDMQDEINKRHSKAMFLLNAHQVIAHSDVIDKKQNDWGAVMDEISRPNGKILLDPSKKDSQFQIVNQSSEIKMQYEYQKDAQDSIRSISGVSGELRGEETNASSGKAIIARGVQGHTILGELFDNYRRSCQLIEEMKWAMVQQFYTKPKAFRITDQMGNYDFLEINKYVSDGTQVLVQNDISKAKVDIVIDEVAYHATVRQALLEQMMEMSAKLPPDIGLLLLDLVVEYSDLPKKDEMVQRIKMIQQMIMGKQAQEQANVEAQNAAKIGAARAKTQGREQSIPGETQAIEGQMMGMS